MYPNSSTQISFCWTYPVMLDFFTFCQIYCLRLKKFALSHVNLSKENKICLNVLLDFGHSPLFLVLMWSMTEVTNNIDFNMTPYSF